MWTKPKTRYGILRGRSLHIDVDRSLLTVPHGEGTQRFRNVYWIAEGFPGAYLFKSLV
jgi:hypothetical protein